MRLQQYMNESPVDASIQEILQILWDKCQPILKEFTKSKIWSKQEWLWSGRKNNADYFIKPIRKDRKPVDTNITFHNRFDQAFLKKFGWKARSNALFVTGDKDSTKPYGAPYGIFPIGDYKYVWSPNIRDLYLKIPYETFDDFLETWVANNKKSEVQDYIDKNFDISTDDTKYFGTRKAVNAIKSQFKKEAIKEWFKTFDDIVEEYYNNQLYTAIKSKKEIMINATSYVAVEGNLLPYIALYFDWMGLVEPNNNNFSKAVNKFGWDVRRTGIRLFV